MSDSTRTRPARSRTGQVTEVNIAGLEVHLTITELPDGRVGEVFLRAGKQGSTIAGLCESLSISTSLALQYGTPLTEVVERLRGSRYEPAGWTSDPDIPQVTSLSDYLARKLETYPRPAAPTDAARVPSIQGTPHRQRRVIRLPDAAPAKVAVGDV